MYVQSLHSALSISSPALLVKPSILPVPPIALTGGVGDPALGLPQDAGAPGAVHEVDQLADTPRLHSLWLGGRMRGRAQYKRTSRVDLYRCVGDI